MIARTDRTGQWTDHGRALYALRRLTACHLLARWTQAGGAWLVLNKGVCEVRSTPDDSAPCWPLDSREAEQILTASVAMGHRYAGWDRSSRWAMRESGAASNVSKPERVTCDECQGEGHFDEDPSDPTNKCDKCDGTGSLCDDCQSPPSECKCGAASPCCPWCRAEGVSREQGGFDDYPEHITHACPACGNGWEERGDRR